MTNRQYLLDTNILIDFLKEVPSVVEKILQVGTHHCCISVISLHELYYGAQLAKEKKEEYFSQELEKINTLLDYFAVLNLNTHGKEYAHIKYVLRKKGKPVDEFDMLIAAHAVSEGLTVVTDNLKHFENMPDVKVENWMER
ncbi:MAG: type II toxin-antitoxin system VapC family toxin [Bacteroidales bacterium]|nr:type II toxin-antitoxin system VapC family toxin [Bacteroidales bacterium]